MPPIAIFYLCWSPKGMFYLEGFSYFLCCIWFCIRSCCCSLLGNLLSLLAITTVIVKSICRSSFSGDNSSSSSSGSGSSYSSPIRTILAVVVTVYNNNRISNINNISCSCSNNINSNSCNISDSSSSGGVDGVGSASYSRANRKKGAYTFRSSIGQICLRLLASTRDHALALTRTKSTCSALIIVRHDLYWYIHLRIFLFCCRFGRDLQSSVFVQVVYIGSSLSP